MVKHLYNGYRIHYSLGQVFLVDNFFIKKIIDFFDPKINENIVEIGPGFGSLTFPIIDRVKNMTLIELDRNLALVFLKNNKYKNKFNVIIKDVMKVDFDSIVKKVGFPMRIIGNLPYYISVSLIFYLFKYVYCIKDMYFMFQKEVADRLLAKKNNKKYGFLSIIVQYIFKIVKLIIIPATAFFPKPKVDSVMLSLVPYKDSPYPICDIKCLCLVAKKAFSQRRKIIKNSLSDYFNTKDFQDFEINPYNRPENLSITDYCNLSIKFFDKYR